MENVQSKAIKFKKTFVAVFAEYEFDRTYQFYPF